MFFVKLAFVFPTSLCGVLVFRFALAAPSAPAPGPAPVLRRLSHLTHHSTTHHTTCDSTTHHHTTCHSTTTQCRRRPPNVAVNCHSRMELRPPTARESHPNFFARCRRSTNMKKYKNIIPNVQNTMRTQVTPMVSNYGKLSTK